jgi:hypothetical protein
MKLLLKTVALSLCLTPGFASGQVSNSTGSNPTGESHIQQVIRALAPDNMLRHALERGERGDGIHQPWMDRMKQLGIKQAGFLIRYSWKGQVVTFKFLNVVYSTEYCSDNSVIRDRKLLKQIHDDGLELELRQAILESVKKSVFAKWHSGQVKDDEFAESLFDDETLPLIGLIF